MNTPITVEHNNLIPHEAAKMLAERLLQTVSQPSGKFISCRNKQFNLGNGVIARTIDCIIMDVVRFNALKKPYVPNQRMEAPECWALGMNDATLAPTNAPKPVAKTCAECPKNEFGSAPNGRGKACSNMYRLAVVPPTADENAEVMLLSVPPTSLKNFNGFFSEISRTHGPIALTHLITTISFDDNFQYPVLMFKSLNNEIVNMTPEVWNTLHKRAVIANEIEPSSD